MVSRQYYWKLPQMFANIFIWRFCVKTWMHYIHYFYAQSKVESNLAESGRAGRMQMYGGRGRDTATRKYFVIPPRYMGFILIHVCFI